MSNRYWMISFHKNTRNLMVRSVPKEDIVHNIELIIRSLNIFIEKFLSIEYINVEGIPLTSRRITIMGLKPGPKPIAKEGANKRGNSSRLTQSFHFFMFEPIFSPVNALNQPI